MGIAHPPKESGGFAFWLFASYLWKLVFPSVIGTRIGRYPIFDTFTALGKESMSLKADVEATVLLRWSEHLFVCHGDPKNRERAPAPLVFGRPYLCI